MGLVSGSSGNASFMWDDVIHITVTGTNLDRLGAGDFAKVTRSGEVIEGRPRKDLGPPSHHNMHDEVTSCSTSTTSIRHVYVHR